MVNTRQYKYYNIPLFKSDLKDIFSTSVFNNENPNDLWYDWKTKFLMVADSHAPPINRSEYTPWVTDDIMKHMRHRDFLKKKAVQTGSPSIHQAHKQARNSLSRKIKSTKTKYCLKYFKDTSKNPKEMWKTINKVVNTKSKTTDIKELIINA
ncbi:Hypothetical predicted protein [Paramuricea clavata]|uniref:Uncharacterized protein n=1 Tax=Paramuricea clavata TaxID=317549 RepID=A0A7D9L2M3_PARCT|nr:Hypothetical predicted protein [Paramuricea clavata]